MILKKILSPVSDALDRVCSVLIVATTVYSGIEYFAKNLDVFKEAD